MESFKQALFVVLNNTEHLDEILKKFLALGVKGATILESEGMATYLMREDPELAYFFKSPFVSEAMRHEKDSKTIFTVIEDLNKVQLVVKELREILEEQTDGPIGFMFSVPVSGIYLLGHKK